MQRCWLVHENRPACILFLPGWGMDPVPFRSIPADGYDVFMAYDYREIAPVALMEETRSYPSLHLLAWSMGIWIAGKFLSGYRERFSSALAINGTLTPIDAEKGIASETYAAMIREFSSDRLEMFYRDMFDDDAGASRFLASRPDRSAASLREELRIMQEKYAKLGPGEDIFSRRLVGSRDRIFPARSQVRSWGRERCETIRVAHFPFYGWPSWDRLIEGGLPD